MGIKDTIHEAAERERYKREHEGESIEPVAVQRVHVVDIKMSFWSMVIFMVKASLASIPAILIIWLLYSILFLGFRR